MAESKLRRFRRKPSSPKEKRLGPTPTWYKVVMFALMILGLVWIMLFYITSVTPGVPQLPIPGIGAWNIAVGFGIIIIGFIMTTRWRG